MKTINSFFLSSLCMLVFSSILSCSATPTIMTEATVIKEKEGSSAVLKCRVSNLGSLTVSWTFVTHDLPIFNGRELVTNDPIKYSIISPLDTPGYDLMLLTVEKSDHGFYRCAINGTDLAVTILLEVEGKEVGPFIPPSANRTDCCIAEGVHADCLEPCSLSTFNPTTFDLLDNCDNGVEDNVKGLTKCLAGNSNHDNCCLFHELSPICLPFCHNEIPDLSDIHAVTCLTQESLGILIKCLGHGFETLPDAPREVTVLPSSTEKAFSLLVSWKAPARNPNLVTGYKIMYRKEGESTYYSYVIKDANTTRYRLTTPAIVGNMQYHVYVAALADQGVSIGSTEVSVFIQDETLSERQNQIMSVCCTDRNVNDECNSLLCHSRTWAHFNFDSVSKCSSSIDDIFSCLAGERDHSSCCQSFGVSPVCLGLCSGSPPPFNQSMITCMDELGIVEACVQQGYDELPTPPNHVRLVEVTTSTATLTFMNSSSQSSIQRYMVEVHEGLADEKNFMASMFLTGDSLSFTLQNLSPNTYYGVRIVTVNTKNFGSLPSDSVFFLTYPASYEQPTTPPVVNVPNDLKACCESKGMPKECSDGCRYISNMTAYFEPIIHLCYSHIGTVLSCASDGRDHRPCCINKGITHEACLDLCRITQDGQLPTAAIQNCITATPTAVECYIEGITYLPRYPNVVVSNVTWHSISLTWKQPETSSLIDTYIIEYGVQSKTKKVQETNKTQYILNDLTPNTAYEITVSSRNGNGTSPQSPVITQYTLQEKSKVPDINYTRPTGDQLWSNISHCCMNSNLPSECVDICLNKEVQAPKYESCHEHRHTMLTCYSDGQDHSECCSRKAELPEACHAVCQGQTQDANPYIFSCLSYGNHEAILSCFLENTDLIPFAPKRMTISVQTSTSIKVEWVKPVSFCGTDCTSVIYYWKFDVDSPNDREVKTIPNVESPYVMRDLDTESFYTISVRAKNSHGSGPPSNLETVFLSGFQRQVRVSLQSNDQYVEKGQTATLECAAFNFNPNYPYTVRWYFNNGREIVPDGFNKNILTIPNVEPVKDEGTYACIVTDSVQTNSDALFLPMKYTPSPNQVRGDTVQPNQNLQAVVECWFNGFPDTGADQWQKDAPLTANPSKYSATVQRHYDTGITIYKLEVANVVNADYGDYTIKVSNKFGGTSCTAKIQNPDDVNPIVPVDKGFNATDCCAKNGVTEKCQDLCGFDIDVAEVVEDPSYVTCLFYFETYIKCGTDNQDHTKCCKNKGVSPFCLPFCAGQSPGSIINEQEKLLECVVASTDIFECAQSGHDLLPYPPYNVILSWWSSGRNVMVRWSRPIHNHDRVEHYVVHYNKAGDTSITTHSVSKDILEYEIEDADQLKDYTVFVTANNEHGSSQPSQTVVLKAIQVPPPSSVDVVVNDNEATLSWDNTPAASPSFLSYNVHYREESRSSYIKVSDIYEATYTLTGLKDKTRYSVYVTTQSKRGHESAPSVYKEFMSGEGTPGPGGEGTPGPGGTAAPNKGGDDDDDKVAIIIGVVVALFAVAAIVFLVVYLVKSRKMNKYTNDTVAFENSSYGNQGAGGSIKFHGMESDDQFNYGRLNEDRVYDNTAVSSTDEGAFANPTFVGEEGKEEPNVATLPVNDNV